MKAFIVAVWIFLLVGMVGPAPARELAIGFSPYVEAGLAEAQIKAVLLFLSETLEPGDRCLVFDAFHLQSIGMFSVPDKSVYGHPKAKIQANRPLVAALFQFAKAARRPQGETEPAVAGAIRLPQALRFIGTDYPVTKDSDLILLGSPLYDDPKERDFTMRRNFIPGDGHLTRTRSTTPYGIKGQESLLANRRVHLAFPDETWKTGENYGYVVHRFWTLAIEGQGGQLVTFSNDLPTVFQRVKANAPSPRHDYKLEASDKLEMFQLRPPTVQHQASIYERPLSTVPVSAQTLRQATNVEVGITWECGSCDMDLYGKSGPQATALSYVTTQTPEGHYFRDWTRSPRSANGYETLAYQVPVDLNSLLLAVNFYNGHSSGGVKGELRISVNDQTYAKAFHITAQDGNGGAGREETLSFRRAINANWLVIDPLEVLGVRSSQNIISRR